MQGSDPMQYGYPVIAATLVAMLELAHFSLAGRTALVGGATQGIGKAIALEFAKLGASVVAMGRNPDGLARTLESLEVLPRSDSQHHATLEADLDDWKSLESKVHAFLASRGPVEILVHNGGGPAAGPAIEASPEHFARGFEHHLLCGQILVQALAPSMRERGYGRIVNIISTSVITPIRGLGVSNTIRGAVANWARTLAVELAPHSITVNSILPGFTRTARLEALFKGRANRAGASLAEVEQDAMKSVPMKRFADPEEIARVAAVLASPAASDLTGVNLPVDGGRLALG
jgi:3-oxoacyl-[acyl-carrier protein] reductase